MNAIYADILADVRNYDYTLILAILRVLSREQLEEVDRFMKKEYDSLLSNASAGKENIILLEQRRRERISEIRQDNN